MNEKARVAKKRRDYLKSLRELVDGKWKATHLPEDYHGDPYTYRYYSCRCIPCCEANILDIRQRRAYHASRRKLVNGRLVAVDVPKEKHGTTNTYNNHECKCEPCCEAKAKSNLKYKKVLRGNG